MKSTGHVNSNFIIGINYKYVSQSMTTNTTRSKVCIIRKMRIIRLRELAGVQQSSITYAYISVSIK